MISMHLSLFLKLSLCCKYTKLGIKVAFFDTTAARKLEFHWICIMKKYCVFWIILVKTNTKSRFKYSNIESIHTIKITVCEKVFQNQVFAIFYSDLILYACQIGFYSAGVFLKFSHLWNIEEPLSAVLYWDVYGGPLETLYFREPPA